MAVLARAWRAVAPRLTEKKLALFLVLLFAGLSAWVLTVPYDAMKMDLPDATTNEIWSGLIREGRYAVTLDEWRARGYPPTQSSVVELEGQRYVVNEKGPGLAMMVAFLDTAGPLTGTLCAGLAMLATYMLGRRLFNWKVGFIASLLVVTNVTVLVMWHRYLWTDAATMHFLVLGAWLLVESLHLFRRGAEEGRQGLNLGATVLGIAGGLAFGFSISTRYPVALVLVAFFLFIFARNAYGRTKGAGRREKGEGAETTKDGRPRRRPFSLPPSPFSLATVLSRSARDAAPFLLGLLLVLAPLMQYNSTYFGGPLRSGYDATSLIDYSRTGNLSERNQSQQWSADWADGAGYVWNNSFALAPLLLARMPLLFLVPFSVCLLRRRPELWLLVPWAVIVFVTYLSLPWVGRYSNLDIVWEPRYFMPALPPLAIAAAFGIERVSAGGGPGGSRVLFAATLTAGLVLAGLLPAEGNFAQIRAGGYQTPGGGPPAVPPGSQPVPPGQFQAVDPARLLSDPQRYLGTLVRVEGVTVGSLSFPVINVTDGPSNITVRFEGYAALPAAAQPGAKVDVQGSWTGQDQNRNGKADPGEFFLNVKSGTADRMEAAR